MGVTVIGVLDAELGSEWDAQNEATVSIIQALASAVVSMTPLYSQRPATSSMGNWTSGPGLSPLSTLSSNNAGNGEHHPVRFRTASTETLEFRFRSASTETLLTTVDVEAPKRLFPRQHRGNTAWWLLLLVACVLSLLAHKCPTVLLCSVFMDPKSRAPAKGRCDMLFVLVRTTKNDVTYAGKNSKAFSQLLHRAVASNTKLGLDFQYEISISLFPLWTRS
ncbi:uncharacterized protein LOC135392249 [Ornithodoros turicata]|uniref:uncharacterized protein LOC135392249 n=1 Tax=Ornithodoros turicata TaxID=34597 RepID=UPI003139FEBF